MSDPVIDLRERIKMIQKRQNGYLNKNEKRNKVCQFFPDQKVLYKGKVMTIIANNTSRGHNHVVQDDETTITHSVINCNDLTLLEN